MAQRHFACTCKSRTSEMLEVTEKVNRHNFLFSPWNVGLHVFSQFGGEIGNTLCCVDTLKCISKRHHPFCCASILPFPGQQQELLAPTALAGTMGKPYLASQGVPFCQTLWWSLGFLSVSWLTPWPHTAHLIPQPPVTWYVCYWEARCKNGDREHLHLCVPGNSTNTSSSLCQHLLGTAVLIPLFHFSLLVLSVLLHLPWVTPEALQPLHLQRDFTSSSSLHHTSVCSMSFPYEVVHRFPSPSYRKPVFCEWSVSSLSSLLH